MSPESLEETVKKMDDFRNDIVGVASFTFGLTALQFTKPRPIAMVCLVFVFLWAFVKISPYRAIHENYYEKLGMWEGNCRAFKSNVMLLLGVVFLTFIAFGVLTLETLEFLNFPS